MSTRPRNDDLPILSELGVREDAARARVSRALRRLRGLLEDDDRRMGLATEGVAG